MTLDVGGEFIVPGIYRGQTWRRFFCCGPAPKKPWLAHIAIRQLHDEPALFGAESCTGRRARQLMKVIGTKANSSAFLA